LVLLTGAHFRHVMVRARHLLICIAMNKKNKKDKDGYFRVGAGTDGLYSQELFRDLLVHERKRSERSNQHFFFVALDIKEVLTSTREDVEVVSHIIRAITVSSREIDIKGWYEDPVCIGIIYTDVGLTGIEQILNKIKQNLAGSLHGDLATRIGITYSIFPEEDGKHWTKDRSSEDILYPPIHSQPAQKRVQLFMKRAFDIVAGGMGLLALSPVFLVVALMIKLTSRGPVFFKQERIGYKGIRFRLFKFRSMFENNNPAIHQEFVKKLIAGQVNVSETGETSYKIQNDPRVTSIGRFIRKTSIDELPQLLNVLLGDMSLVGPRPPIAYEVEDYEIWHRPRVVEVRPGITGLWQVKGRSKTSFDGMVRMDLEYIHTWSLWLDIKLLLKTPAAAVIGRGAC
jgi:lipopolysaccharide/colanic/teichoic acid biosynthesis glycosyltransferase